MNSVILSAATRLLVSLMLVFSLFMLLRGHNEPGGGFIGGLLAATGYALYAIAHGAASARRALRMDPLMIAVIGLGVALCAGLMAALADSAFLTGLWWFAGASADSKGLPISSVLMFDVGVYLVVVGAVLTFVFALEEED